LRISSFAPLSYSSKAALAFILESSMIEKSTGIILELKVNGIAGSSKKLGFFSFTLFLLYLFFFYIK